MKPNIKKIGNTYIAFGPNGKPIGPRFKTFQQAKNYAINYNPFVQEEVNVPISELKATNGDEGKSVPTIPLLKEPSIAEDIIPKKTKSKRK